MLYTCTLRQPDISQLVKFAGSDNSQFVAFQGRTFLSQLFCRVGQFFPPIIFDTQELFPPMVFPPRNNSLPFFFHLGIIPSRHFPTQELFPPDNFSFHRCSISSLLSCHLFNKKVQKNYNDFFIENCSNSKLKQFYVMFQQ